MWEEVAQGSVLELYSGLRQYDYLIPEGSRAMLQLNLRLPVSQGVADTVENALEAAGIPDVKVTTASPVLRIYFRKGFPWLPVVVGVILPLLITLAIVVVSWQLFKETGPATGSLILIAGIGVAALAGIMLLRRVST